MDKPGSWTRIAAPAALLLAAGGIAYGNGLAGPFVYDDQIAIADNPALRALWPPGAVLWPEKYGPLAGRPLASLSFALNYAVGGLDVRGYHAVNLALHLLSALTLFGLVARTLEAPGLAARTGASARSLALAAALLWLVHPLQTESVDYLTQRTGLLAGLFYLLTLYAGARALDEPGPRWWGVAIGSCVFAMASKEVAVTAPLLVVLYHACFARPGAMRAQRPLYAGLFATWLLAALLIVPGPRADTVGFSLGVSAFDYAKNQCVVIVSYLRQAVWPHPLAFDYGRPQALSLAAVWPQALLLTTLGAGTLLALLRRPALGFPAAAFFIILAPTSSIVPIVTEVGAERRMYLPLAALCVLAVTGAHAALRPTPRWLGPALLIAAVVALVGVTRARNRDYQDPVLLWQSAVAARPGNARAHVNLAVLLLARDRLPEAEQPLRQALELSPADPLAHYNLGLVLGARGEHPAAIASYRSALAVQEDLDFVHYALGLSLRARGQEAMARSSLGRALALARRDGNEALAASAGRALRR